MAQLTSNKKRDYDVGRDEVPSDLPAANADIFEGSALSVDGSGHARQLDVADANFAGFALRKLLASGTAGSKNIRHRTQGLVVLVVTGLAATDVGVDVHATDGDTFAKAGGVVIGKVHRVIDVASEKALVAFEAASLVSR